jgi:queuosine precursor transporter
LTTEPGAHAHNRHRHYRYYDLVMAGFVAVLLCSNLIGPGKVCTVSLPFALPLLGSALTFGAGNLFFPISYIFGDVLTEVYGYARARKVIWAGFLAMLFASVMSWVVIHMPVADTEYNKIIQPALETVFGGTWRIVLGSIIAFWCGDFVNSFVLARMKVLMRGKRLWARTIGSTFVGQAIDSVIFYPLAFYGVWDNTTLINVIGVNWLIKVSVEVLFTPLTYVIVNGLKRAESEDFYDTDTNFTPFSLQD